jgi:hypothetical protein
MEGREGMGWDEEGFVLSFSSFSCFGGLLGNGGNGG